MVDPLAPHEIARRTFDVARRGYEQQEVRGFLHEVSALLERLTRSENELRERAERAEARVGATDEPDEGRLLEILGEETTRVLVSARDAATEIRSKAEAAAERMIAEATSEAADLRASAMRERDALLVNAAEERESLLEVARTELARRTEEAAEEAAQIREEAQAQVDAFREEGQADLARARAEAEAALEVARQHGREMVAEAQAVRERVLRDLALRRKRARQQVEKLNAGRERLLQAYDLVRRTIDEATGELSVALTEARIAANAAARRIEDEPDTTLEELDAEVAAAGLIDLPIAEVDVKADLADEEGSAEHDDYDDHEGSGPLSGEVPVIESAPRGLVVISTSGAASGSSRVADVPAEPTASSQQDDRRGRRGRRRKDFEGLPAGELTVLEPPDPDEGVRILADAAGPTSIEPPPIVEAAPTPGPIAEEDADGADLHEDGDSDEGPADGLDVVALELDSAPSASAEPGPADPVADEPVLATEEGDAVSSEAPPLSSEADPEPVGDAEPLGDAGSVDDVFARLRTQSAAAGAHAAVDAAAPEPLEAGATLPAEAVHAEVGDDVVGDDVVGEVATEESAVDDEPSAEGAPFVARAQMVEPVQKELGRRVKRTLADEQNEVLDLLRRAKPKGVDDLLPGVDAHAARWADTVEPVLAELAARAAAAHGGTTTSVADLADEMARGLTAPLRERIDRSFVAADGNLDDIADRVRALYREWKGQRLTETVQHFAAAAYARGVFDAISAGANVRWVLDPSTGACPDCDDNVLGGAITKGEAFPTGNPCAPAHPGCHCLVLAAPG